MSQTRRLNSLIRTLEQGNTPIATFAPPSVESAIALSTQPYDGLIFEAEHNPYDVTALRDCLQYLLNRRQILERGTIAPAVTPTVRIPANGGEMNQWLAKQVLDIGAYGVVWPRVSSAEQAYNAVAACRYPRPRSATAYEPEGQRGDSPVHAARYWGLTPQEPLSPHGEILVIVMCEEVKAIDNLPRMLKEVPGIGVVLIGEGDLSQNLGCPRQYDHPAVVEAMTAIRRICSEHGVPCGHPHVDSHNARRIVEEGYRFLVTAPTRAFAGLEACRSLIGRT
jgi:4-hydroxy-2-oxoheptanedioate aldolase